MQKVRVIVAKNGQVVCGGVAMILNSAENLEIVGHEGNAVLEEAFVLQPDLLVYELSQPFAGDYETLGKVKKLCGWTKIILYSASSLDANCLRKFLVLCDGYLQGPILPGFLLKAVELACYSGYFFFLGFSKDIKPESKAELQLAIPENFSGEN
ncbi:response regulator transcription factor [Desulfallas sp. Bu1-1]|uniref:response regulator transcription factor n=1 Tax=Desulfallas sp. Bu1-1 TaxID=2787620 RepID=UPI00189FB6E2|nr:response regulator transcription factor [Desulfallas sp. Bu1-1]MBF7083262.1 response regulator transcription factor [Desulfallas sp. Bu1-1]